MYTVAKNDFGQNNQKWRTFEKSVYIIKSKVKNTILNSF